MVSQLFKMGLHKFHINLYLHKIFEPVLSILFLTPMDYIHGSKGNFGQIWKGAKFLKPERLHPPIFVYMHFMSTSTFFFDPHGL